MSRVTPPVTKLTQVVRRLSTSASASRPSGGLLERQLKAGTGKNEQSSPDSHAYHTIINTHRPTTKTSKSIPLMQGFRTSAPKQTSHDQSTIDHFAFPSFPASTNILETLRVPLLPDNYSLNRSSHARESIDAPLSRPEISIIASHPENVAPVALSEVVGNEAVEVDIGVLAGVFEVQRDIKEETGILEELWGGLMEDILGKGGKGGVNVAF